MKKNSLIISLCAILISGSVYSQKKTKNILKSTNIQEIEEYLKNAHPEDPKKSVLKPKLIALKNSEWTKGSKNAKPMEARPVINDIPKSIMRRSNSSEAEEFKRLITEASTEHKTRTAKLMNTMFDKDISSKEAILLVKNNSDCNLVLRIQGKDFYNMAVSARSENFIVVNKGSYTLSSNVCDVKYNSQKDIKKSIFVTLENPTTPNAKANISNISSTNPDKSESPTKSVKKKKSKK